MPEYGQEEDQRKGLACAVRKTCAYVMMAPS